MSTECSNPCGGGNNLRYRFVQRPAQYGGRPCIGNLVEKTRCSTDPGGGKTIFSPDHKFICHRQMFSFLKQPHAYLMYYQIKEVTEVAMTEIATTFKILQTGNSYIRK